MHMPGDTYLYSSYGYNLVSAIIEAVSGQAYLAYMSAKVFEPLGMGRTSPDYLERIIPGRGRFWIRPEDGLVIGMISNMSDFDFGTILISLGEVFVSE